MNILYLTSWYPNRKDRLDGNFIQNHVRALAKVNFVHLVFTTSFSTKNNDYEIEKFSGENYRETIIYFPYHSFKFVRFYRKLKAYYLGIKQVGQIDIIQAHVFFYAGVLAGIIGFLKNKKVLLTENSTRFFTMSLLEKMIFFLTKNLITIYTPVGSHLKKEYTRLGISPEKIQIIFNTIDTEYFSLKKEIQREQFHFLHISKFDIPRKNVKGIIEAFKLVLVEYPDSKLTILGDGDLSILKSMILESRIDQTSIEVITTIENHKLVSYYHQADGFILFSQSENNPLVVLEALSCGLPVISSDVGNVKDFITKENGIIVRANHVSELSEAMKSMIKSRSEYNPSQIRQSIINQVSYIGVSKAYDDLYKKLI